MIIKVLGTLLLATLLSIMAYMAFWFAAVTYAEKQLQGAVENVLGAEMTYSRMVWQPNVATMAMKFVSPRLTFKKGPLQDLFAENMIVETGLLQRDNWQLHFPQQVTVTLQGGQSLRLRTQEGEVVWIARDQSLSLRAATVESEGGALKVDDVVLEYKPSAGGIKVNLASRPMWNGRQGQLSGQIVMPPKVFAGILELVARHPEVGLNGVMHQMVASLHAQGGGTLALENISFKTEGKGAGVSGQVQVDAQGLLRGKVMVIADTKEMLDHWVALAGIRMADNRSWNRVERGLNEGIPALRLETQQDTLLVNGMKAGGLPNMNQVVAHLWP